MARLRSVFAAEEVTDAIVDADVPFEPGTARAALRHRDFRVFWYGTAASNVGTWMQNVVLIAFGYELTGSPVYAGLLTFGQLGPLLFLGPVGGALADRLDRRRLLVVTQLVQLVLSCVLALLAAADQPSETLLFACVLGVGIGSALGAPSLPSIVPSLVGRDDLGGAISLMSAQMNISRVIGPAIGGVLYPALGAPVVFALNAATYLFAVAVIVTVRFPRRADAYGPRPGLLSGFGIVTADPLIRACITTVAALSFFSLAFIGLMPALAEENLDIRAKSAAFGLLYATFGSGAASGALAVGTVLARRSKPALVSVGLAAFAAALVAFATVTVAALAYPLAFAVGVAYFTVVTSLNTTIQLHVDDAVRGRVMAIWIMAFGGTVPLGTLLAGAMADRTGVPAVVVAGALVAGLLGVYARRLPRLADAAAARETSSAVAG